MAGSKDEGEMGTLWTPKRQGIAEDSVGGEAHGCI